MKNFIQFISFMLVAFFANSCGANAGNTTGTDNFLTITLTGQSGVEDEEPDPHILNIAISERK